jgi:hypothetical protein
MMEIATSAGQKILFSGRGTIKLCSVDIPSVELGKTTTNSGDTIIT